MAYLTSGKNKIMGSSVSTDVNVVTVIDDTCTDEQVPSALATKAYVDSKDTGKDYVEITQAEYDLLTDEEKEDIVFYIKDGVTDDGIVTVIDENSTDEQVPSAKAVHTAIQNVSGGVPVNAYTKEEVNNLLDDKVNTDDLVDAYSKDEMDTLLADKANTSDTYNKTEIDALLDGKANTDDVTTNGYTKDEVDDLLADKADSSAIVDAYNKEEVDNLLDTKPDYDYLKDLYYDRPQIDNLLEGKVNQHDVVDAYSKTEVNGLLNAKVNTSSVVTALSSSSTDEEIPSAKTVFDAIQSVSAGVPADVYSKTDVDDLLADKANTADLVDAYSKTEVNDLLDDKANVADIIDAYTKEEVNDLLADKADSSSLIDAYTKEEVNTLLDDKVNTDDLVDAYSKEEVNNLLDGKADSSAIVDSYSKTEVDTLLTGKADSSSIIDAYTKDEVDDLLDSKADSSSIVDAYTKGEVDGLLADKVSTDDLVETYSKTEIDDLLADKADSTDIVDAYTKGEVDNLLTGKADSSAIIDAYTKTEVNNLLADKADTDDLVDAYSKTEVDNLLDTKADSADIIDAYSKTEVDDLLADKANVDDLVDSYTKTETDDLLTAKADTTALDELEDNLQYYINEAKLNNALRDYVTITNLANTLADYSLATDVDEALENTLDFVWETFATKTSVDEINTDLTNNVKPSIATNTTNIATNTTRIYGIPKRNILINGEFQVNKHKTSIPEGNITTRYVIDRWATNKSGLWISANTITNSAEQKQVNSGHSLNVQVEEGYTGISIYQIIENAKILYTGKTLTMSFWVKGKYAEGKTITARIGSSGSNTGATTVTLTDSWQYVTTTRKDCLFGGRDDAGVVITSSDTFDDYSGFEIACVKLELGDTATPFEHIPYAEELLMCQKYHMKIDGVDSNSELGLGHFSAIPGNTVYPIVYLPTPMRTEPNRRVTPTLTSTVSGLELYGCNSARTAYEVRTVTNLSIYAIKDNLVTFKCETDGEFALGTSGDFRIKRNGSQYRIELDAELY